MKKSNAEKKRTYEDQRADYEKLVALHAKEVETAVNSIQDRAIAALTKTSAK